MNGFVNTIGTASLMNKEKNGKKKVKKVYCKRLIKGI
jgi:hypothetical protein